MVGGGGKRKGKSGSNAPPPAATTAAAKVTSDAAAADAEGATLVKEEKQPSIGGSEPTLDTTEITSIPTDSNDASVVNPTLSATMEPSVGSASDATDAVPSNSKWGNLDSIPEFIPKSLPSEPMPVSQQPLVPTNGPPILQQQPVAAGTQVAAVQDHKWRPNLGAASFFPTAAPTHIMPTYQPQSVPLVYSGPTGPIPSYVAPFKVSGGPYFVSYPPATPQPPSGQKHIIPRTGPPGPNYEQPSPMGYPLDVHGMPLKQETVNINLNGKKPGQYMNNVGYPPVPYQPMSEIPPFSVAMAVSNNIQVAPKAQAMPVREPVNVSAANLSNEPPAVTKAHPTPLVKDKIRSVQDTEVKPVAELKINSVMKVEETVEDDGEEVKPGDEKMRPSPNAKEIPPAKVEKPAVQPKEAAVSQKKEERVSLSAEKPRVSPPTTIVKKESTPSVCDKVTDVAKPTDKVDGLSVSKVCELPAKVNAKPKAHESAPAKAEVKLAEKETSPLVSHNEVEKLAPSIVKPIEAAPPSKPSPAFNFNSFTNISNVQIHDADKFRSSLKQRSLNRNTEEDENLDPKRKKYSRDQLIELRNKPASIKLPGDFTSSIDIFSEGAGSRTSTAPPMDRSGGGFANMVNFGGGGGSYRGSASQHYRDRDLPQQIIHSVSLKEEVKLKTTENAWKPQALKKDPVERIVMDAKSLLNKLSPENFNSILKKFVQLPINDENMVKIIDVIMFKAVWEPKFAEVYARFIEGMKRHYQLNPKKSKQKEEEKDDLTQVLMKKCALEFEAIVKSDKENKAKLEVIKKIADEKEREEARVAFEEEEMLGRKKSVGVMTFIGELFKLRLLHPKILHGCFHELLKRGNDVENLECLAKLITSTGKAVETLNSGDNEHANISRSSWEKVMTAIKFLVSDKNKDKIPSRLRFMILDVLDLKSRGWVPRMAENKPKTMAQIDKDIENESMRKSMQMRDDEKSGPMSKVPNKKPQQNQSTQAQQPSFQKLDKIDTDKFKGLMRNEHQELNLMPSYMNMSLGATGASGFKSAQSKARGAFPLSSPAPPPPLTQKNSFSVLSMPETLDTKAKSIPPPSNMSRTPQKSKQVPPTPVETKPAPPVVRDDNAAFEKLLAVDKQEKDNYDIEDEYRNFLSYGGHFTDTQDFKSSNNQYREEVINLVARCLNHLNEPMLSFSRLEKLYLRFVDKIEEEVNRLGKEKFDARGLTRSLLLDLLAKRPADHIFVSALLISLIEKHKKWGSCIELLRDFLIYCTKSDILDDYPNATKVVGDVLGYLVCFDSLKLVDYKKQLLIKYNESVSTNVFVHMVRSIARLRGPHALFKCFPSEESLKEVLSPLFYRKYRSGVEFDPLDFNTKLAERLKLGFLLDKSLTSEQACRFSTSDDHPSSVNICLHYFVSHAEFSLIGDYLRVNFSPEAPGVLADVCFALTQKVCYESLEPQGGRDEDAVTYKLNEAKFRTLYGNLVSNLTSLDSVLPSLYSILDVNLHLQLPGGLLLSQFVLVKELLVESPLGDLAAVNATFKRFKEDKSLYHSPASKVATVLSKALHVQESGFSKTSALPSLNNFYHQIDAEEEESEEEGEK